MTPKGIQKGKKELGGTILLTTAIATQSTNTCAIAEVHNILFSPATIKINDKSYRRTVAGLRIAGLLLSTPMVLDTSPPQPPPWEDPICGLTDIIDHLDDKNISIETLTKTLTTCYIEMWANSIVHPGTHTTPDQITDMATIILMDHRIWTDQLLKLTHNGTANPWPAYLITHVIMMATAYGTRTIPPHLLLHRWKNKITHLLTQWVNQIDNTNNIEQNLEIFSEMACCILWLDDTPKPRLYQISQELEKTGLSQWHNPAKATGDRYTELHTNLTITWLIASAHTHMDRSPPRLPLCDITHHTQTQLNTNGPTWTPCSLPVAVLGDGLHWDLQDPLTATKQYEKNVILTAFTGKPVRKLHLNHDGNNVRLLGTACRCQATCD